MQSRTLEILSRLVAFDTTSRNGNLDIIAFIEDYLASFGIEGTRVDYEPGKTNLYATIGPRDIGGVALSAHTDVVPVDGQDWASDPFKLTVRGDRAYGRGAADMKGFLAAMLAQVPDFIERPLRTPIHLAFSCDEEVGCRGVRPLVAHLAANEPRPAAVIVGEPTNMRVVDAHKSIVSYETVVTGHEAHSSLTHLGVNAIMVAGEVIAEVNRIAREKVAEGDPSGRFVPPCSTVHIGLIAGGTAKNIVPRHCSFTWETRLLPGADPQAVKSRVDRFGESLSAELRKVAPEAGIETRCINTVPGLGPAPGSPAETLALLLAKANGTDAVSYGTEAGLFQKAGMPAIVCGPGSIEQAHKPNEFIELAELEKCEAFLQRLAEHCRG